MCKFGRSCGSTQAPRSCGGSAPSKARLKHVCMQSRAPTNTPECLEHISRPVFSVFSALLTLGGPHKPGKCPFWPFLRPSNTLLWRDSNWRISNLRYQKFWERLKCIQPLCLSQPRLTDARNALTVPQCRMLMLYNIQGSGRDAATTPFPSRSSRGSTASTDGEETTYLAVLPPWPPVVQAAPLVA